MSRRTRREAASHLPRKSVWRGRLGWIVAGVVALATCFVIRTQWGPEIADAQVPFFGGRDRAKTAPTGPPAARQPQKPQVVATVNGRPISRQELAGECLARFGEEVLESLVNKHLIAYHLERRNLVVTDGDVADEIDNMARKFGLGRDQWLKLATERGISQRQYARDVVWPMLALRKIAADRIVPNGEEVRKLYESRYGPAVKARLLTVANMDQAQNLHAQLRAQPDEFARLARLNSLDAPSASVGGLIHPIRRHLGSAEIEQVAFAMQVGEISPIVRIGEQYAILKCEGHIPPRNVPLAEVQAELEEKIRDQKLRGESEAILRGLQADARVENIYNHPERAKSRPGVAALVNDQAITVRELAEECIARYGEEVLGGEVNRILLEEALKSQNVQVTQADLDAEIGHAAEISGVVDAAGRPDIARWIAIITEQQKVSQDIYVRDAVWPSAALKKLVGGTVTVEQQDMQRGFEANYGQRVRCRAIVLERLRRAQEVWDKARRNPTVEFFGRLAEEYSVEASSRSLKGEVPPIKRFGGQPALEQAAFSLRPGELSEIVQVGERFVILLCEGYTEPVKVDFAEVQDMVYAELFEKKLRVAMNRRFSAIKDSAQVDNFLTGTSQSPRTARRTGP